ncbi:MAG: RHS repeat-associated core domain-containing protein, partial [Coriobacteriia bacterium]|nr:RHS repeat-associated core domain-containing protein [Coriobacteriia bacterium]
WEGGRLSSERDSDGTLYRYVFAPDGTPLALERTTPGAPAEVLSYHTDAQGSVVAITDPTGSIVASYRYDAFGAVTSATGSDPIAARNPLRYRAYYHDTSTGLYCLPARYYDPATARFLSQDPAPPVAGDPLSLNRYTYCAGDPVNFTDPDGARHEAGSGVGGPVATEAIEYARRGDMDAATAVQAAYRDGLQDGYAAGYDYDRAHALAERAAQEDAKRRSWALTSPHEDPTGFMFSTVGMTCDLLAIATAESVIGSAIFIGLGSAFGVAEVFYTLNRYRQGRASRGDLAMALVGVVPLLGMYKPLRGIGTVAQGIDYYDYISDGAELFATP